MLVGVVLRINLEHAGGRRDAADEALVSRELDRVGLISGGIFLKDV